MKTTNSHALNTDHQHEAKTVLVVDDDAKLLRGLERSFSDEPFRVLTAISPAEANVVLIKEHVDLIISDNLMSGTLGTDFLSDVRRNYPNIQLLILSGYIPPAAAKRAIEEIGVLRVLTKPCESSEIASAIREAFDRAAVVGSESGCAADTIEIEPQ